MDHGLRPEAGDECALVEREAVARGCPVWTEHLGVAPGGNLQERARAARRATAERIADHHGYDLIATGHTATDQAETVLFRLARGTGRTGAIGMREQAGRWVRPLITLTRDETRAWCEANGVPWVDDPSNRDEHFARVRIRQTVVPALQSAHPGAIAALNRFARQLADEQDVLDPIVDAAWEVCVAGHGLGVRALAMQPPALARLVVRRLLRQAGVVPDERWVDAVIAMAHAGEGVADMPGARVGVTGAVIGVMPSATPSPDHALLGVPGVVDFGDRRIRATRATATAPSPTVISLRDATDLQVRSPRPGDRIALAGGGRARVGRLLAAMGVAAHLRNQVPVVLDRGRIVWVAGYRANPQALAAPGDNAIRLELV
jgi:tRNA(Ile)-lysidine synthase